MRAVINGKRYDTETATPVVEEWANGYGIGDFRYCIESLCRTRRGAWFAAGKGGPRSVYAESLGQNSWVSGSGIRPLSAEAAMRWLEKRGRTAELEKYFGDEIEDA